MASRPPDFPLPAALDQALRHAEDAVRTLSAALLQDQADRTEAAALALQQRTADLGQAWAMTRRAMPGWTPGPDVAARLQAVRRSLAAQREASLRRGALTERALETIMPASRSSTYQGAAGQAYARGQARQTGAFRLLSA